LSDFDPDRIQLIDDLPRRRFDIGVSEEDIRKRDQFLAKIRAEEGQGITWDPSNQKMDLGEDGKKRGKNKKKKKKQPIRVFAPESPESVAQTRQEYERLKLELVGLTVALGVAGTVGCYLFFSQEASISFGVGSLGGLAYLVLLARRVDAGIGGPAGIVIPVALALLARKYDALDMFPSLIGFFMYKAAVLLHVFKDLFKNSYS